MSPVVEKPEAIVQILTRDGRTPRDYRLRSGAKRRPQREAMMDAARRREIDAILVWRLDRWGRSLLDLIGSLQELGALNVGFVSLSEALDMTTPSGRALAGMLAVFAEFERDILRDRVKAGIAEGRGSQSRQTSWTTAHGASASASDHRVVRARDQ